MFEQAKCGLPLRVCSLFSGVGGIELGLSFSGHFPVLFCESDVHARSVLAGAFPGVTIAPDIQQLEILPDCDLVTAGWPCQDLSLAGQTKGLAGAKSSLIGELFRLLAASSSKPSYILLENVAFALDLQGGHAVNVVLHELEKAGYRWAYRILDTLLFGLPQRRRRLFILASLFGEPEGILFDGIQSSAKQASCSPALIGFYWTEGTRGTGWSPEAVPPLKGGSGLGIPSPPAIWDIHSGRFLKPGIEDAERLQGFPVNWTRCAEAVPNGKSRRWILIGNAVSVSVSRWIGARLLHEGNADFQKSDMGRSNRLPRAAFGGPDMTSFSVNVSNEGPSKPIFQTLSDFGLVNASTLSARAISGFARRLQASRLKKSPSFIRALAVSLEDSAYTI